MKEVRTIKRYQNRKLYDTFQSCYVTLEEIAQIIREGHEIQVIDNKTKKDITYMTQIQLLFDQERKSVNAIDSELPNAEFLDTELLKEVIRGPEGTFTGYIRAIRNGASPQKVAKEEPLTETTPSVDRFGPPYVQQQQQGNGTASTETTQTLN